MLFWQPLLSLYYTTFHIDMSEQIIARLPRWTYDTAGPTIQKQIFKQSKIINLYALCNFLLIIVTAIVLIVPMQGDDEMYFPIYFGNQYSNIIGIIASIYYRSCFVAMIFLIPAQAYHLMASSFHAKFQIYMWNKFIEEIITDNILLNKNCQYIVKLRLKYCINRHQQIIL